MKESSIKNRRILIRNIENGETIADTKIKRFDSMANAIYISADSIKDIKYYKLSVFIFADNCLYEYYGTTKGVMVGDEIKVLLGKHKDKDDRSRTRYPVVLEGSIDGIIIEGKLIELRKAIYIKTVNMSANGILMEADSGCFTVGDCFSVRLKVEGRGINLHCKIVRVKSKSMLTDEYGCKIVEIWINR
ncbi:MAG: PilZ domain-containing protein [Lachnospiraceae bacterium]|nr:PilZ domain-containing protein [Lachnospiraceae bacterium]